MPSTGATRSAENLAGLRVCVVACHFEPESTGSAPYNTMLVETLADAGAAVDVVTGVPHYPQWRVTDPRYRYGLGWRETSGSVRVTRVRHAVPRQPNLVGRLRLEASFAALSAPLVAASSADVIVAVTPLVGAPTAAHLGRRGRRLGVIVHDLSGNAAVQSGTAGGSAGRMVAAAEYRLLAGADLVGVITPRFTQPLVEHGVDPERIRQLPVFTHVDHVDLTPGQARERLGWATEGLTVVHTGNMGMKQGLEHVVSAARAAHDADIKVNFVLVGDGNCRDALVSQAADLPNIRFVDPVSEDDYPVVLAAADVLLLHEKPGVTEMSLPSKLTSYAQAGRPILAAVEDRGITKALLDTYGAAVTTRCGDTAAMLGALRRLAEDPDGATSVIAGAVRMADAEFAADRGRACFRQFVRDLADGVQ